MHTGNADLVGHNADAKATSPLLQRPCRRGRQTAPLGTGLPSLAKAPCGRVQPRTHETDSAPWVRAAWRPSSS
jgi:hypothetical protein